MRQRGVLGGRLLRRAARPARHCAGARPEAQPSTAQGHTALLAHVASVAEDSARQAVRVRVVSRERCARCVLGPIVHALARLNWVMSQQQPAGVYQ